MTNAGARWAPGKRRAVRIRRRRGGREAHRDQRSDDESRDGAGDERYSRGPTHRPTHQPVNLGVPFRSVRPGAVTKFVEATILVTSGRESGSSNAFAAGVMSKR